MIWSAKSDVLIRKEHIQDKLTIQGSVKYMINICWTV